MDDRESVLDEIRYFTRLANVVMLLGFLFLALGIICDSLNITNAYTLKPMSWFLMAIFCMVGSINPKLHVVAGKHLLGMKTENKKRIVNPSIIFFFLRR
jgi:hypothetical protein